MFPIFFILQAGGPISRFLQQVKVPHVTSQECNNDYANIGGITQGMICAGKKGKDSCQVKILNTEVDSKGHLISNGHFVFFNFPKKRTKNFCPSRLGQKFEFSSSFFGRIGDTKKVFRN